MMRLVLLLVVFSAAVPSRGETFTLGRFQMFETSRYPDSELSGSADKAMVCLDENGVRPCRETDPVEALHRPATLEVSCSSETMQIESDIWPVLHRNGQPATTVRVQYQGQMNDVPIAVARQIVRGRSDRSVSVPTVNAPIDVWAGPVNRLAKTAIGNDCGGSSRSVHMLNICSAMRTSVGWIYISDLLDNRSRTRLQVSRDAVWEFLKERKQRADWYDQSESAEPEESGLKLNLYQVRNPGTPKRSERSGFITSRNTRHGPPAGEYLLLGKPAWNDIEVDPPSGPGANLKFFWMSPRALHNELNRLQDFYNACSSSPKPASTATDPEPELEGFYETTRRETIIKLGILKEDEPEFWNYWKDRTLEEFADSE